MKKLLLAIGLLLAPMFVIAQITPPYTFSAGQTISSSQVNANFNKFSDALNRTGGTITGNIAADANVTIDGVDISDFLTSTQVLTQVVGSVGTPSYSVVGDLNTGIYFPAADQFGVTLGGTSRLTLTATTLTVPGLTVGSVTNASVPANMIAFTSDGACPTGWSEYTSARGRYIVGLVSGGTNEGTAGTELTDVENRAVGQHNHNVTDAGHTHAFSTRSTGGSASISVQNSGRDATAETVNLGGVQSNTTGISINNSGSVAGTNAPYIQLMACKKD